MVGRVTSVVTTSVKKFPVTLVKLNRVTFITRIVSCSAESQEWEMDEAQEHKNSINKAPSSCRRFIAETPE
jgi:hypothetical protein